MTDSGRFTAKQVDILESILKGSDDGGFVDTDELMEMLSYNVSKGSLQFSIRFLVKRGLVEKKPREIRRGRRRAVYALTVEALRSFDTSTGSFDVVEEGLEGLEDL
tara:strand:- start:22569 stop:22886 length:318 start_codon:yes stop_codon:yes gene_type:complete